MAVPGPGRGASCRLASRAATCSWWVAAFALEAGVDLFLIAIPVVQRLGLVDAAGQQTAGRQQAGECELVHGDFLTARRGAAVDAVDQVVDRLANGQVEYLAVEGRVVAGGTARADHLAVGQVVLAGALRGETTSEVRTLTMLRLTLA